MKSFRSSRSRRWLATAAGVAVLAVGLAFVPISYDHIIGYEARLSLAGSAPAAADAQRLAAEFMKALRAANVSYSTQTVSAGATDGLAIVARVPHGSRAAVERTADAFARVLTRRGAPAGAQVRPLVEHALGSVYALAADRVVEIRVERADKSPAQLEAEIRAGLEASGFGNPSVSVTQEGEQTRIDIRAQGGGTGTSGARVIVERK